MDSCKLGFADQCKLVWEGVKRGYKYDGCTSAPDFNFGYDCCGEHDFHYQATDITRKEADRLLRECIQKKGYVVLPWVYWAAVRMFGRGLWKRKQDEARSNLPTGN